MSEEKKHPSGATPEAAAAPVAAPTQRVMDALALPKADAAQFPVKAILAEKVGMTTVYDAQGNRVPVTVVSTSTCSVTNVRTKDRDGYPAVQLGIGQRKEKNQSQSYIGQFKAKNIPTFSWLKEFPVENPEQIQIGLRVPVEIFAEGDYVDISGTSKGKGYAGPMKRHNFRGLTASHGASDKIRARGSSGGGSGQPQRVLKGTRMAGRLGSAWITSSKIEVVKVDAENELLLLKGSVPGAAGSFLVVRQTLKARKKKLAVAAQKVSSKKAAVAGKKEAPKKK